MTKTKEWILSRRDFFENIKIAGILVGCTGVAGLIVKGGFEMSRASQAIADRYIKADDLTNVNLAYCNKEGEKSISLLQSYRSFYGECTGKELIINEEDYEFLDVTPVYGTEEEVVDVLEQVYGVVESGDLTVKLLEEYGYKEKYGIEEVQQIVDNAQAEFEDRVMPAEEQVNSEQVEPTKVKTYKKNPQ